MNAAVVIATYNEAETIGDILVALSAFDVFVVDDNSPDGTGAIVRQHANARLIERPGKLGIASAYCDGLRAALNAEPAYDYIVQMDAGGTHNPALVQLLVWRAQTTGAGVVIGSRFAQGAQWKGYRSAISLGAAWLMRRVGVRVQDATSGFRCWRRDVLTVALEDVRARGFAFQLETLWRASRLGARVIEEVPMAYSLTNSSFNSGMVREALGVWARLAWATWRL